MPGDVSKVSDCQIPTVQEAGVPTRLGVGVTTSDSRQVGRNPGRAPPRVESVSSRPYPRGKGRSLRFTREDGIYGSRERTSDYRVNTYLYVG